MAIDEALLREVREPVLRIYEWSVPAVSLGYFQPAALAGDRPFVRRYTGGGLVDHAHDVTYTLVLPRAHPWMELSAPESYRLIHEGVQAVLTACGVASQLTPAAPAMESEACFAKPVKFDIVSDAGKLSGAAQRRTREGMLHQGSILLPEPRMNPMVRRMFPDVFMANLGLGWSGAPPHVTTAVEELRATELEHERYSTEAWNRLR
jgi:lipoyl(octanoyl) transferase